MDSIKPLRHSIYKYWQNEIFPNVLESDKVLEIGPMVLKEFLYPEFFVNPREKIQNYTSVDIYQDTNIDIVCDILNLNQCIEDNSHDVIIALEVIEHVSKPWLVPEILSRILKDQGRIYISTPFYFLWHDPRPDYWRFSYEALEMLFSPYFHIEIEPLIPKDDDGRHPIHHKLKGVKK